MFVSVVPEGTDDKLTLPLTNKLPVKECISVSSSPNFVDPDLYKTEEEIKVVLNSCVSIYPVTINEPVIVTLLPN